MLSTVTIKYIIEDLVDNLFDFNYDFEEITIGDKTYNKQYIESKFVDYWWYYYIGYSTVEEFKWRLKRSWLDKIEVFSQKLKLYPQELALDERKITRNFNSTYANTTDNKYSDTPNEPMAGVDDSGNYLTDRTYINNDGENNINSTITESKNELTKYAEVHNKIKNLLYDFIKSFDNLFITDVIMYDGIVSMQKETSTTNDITKQDINLLKQDVGNLKQDVGNLKQDVAVNTNNIDINHTDIGNITDMLATTEELAQNNKERLDRLNGQQIVLATDNNGTLTDAIISTNERIDNLQSKLYLHSIKFSYHLDFDWADVKMNIYTTTSIPFTKESLYAYLINSINNDEIRLHFIVNGEIINSDFTTVYGIVNLVSYFGIHYITLDTQNNSFVTSQYAWNGTERFGNIFYDDVKEM